MLIKSARQYLIDTVNANAGLALTSDDVTFGLPVALAETTAEGSNTQVRITLTQQAPARGAMNLQYHRIPFTSVFTDADGINPMRFPIGSTANTSLDIVGQIKRFCGVDIVASDLVQTDIDWVNSRVLIKASPESLGWLGEITAVITPGDVVIGDAFTVTSLTNSFLYPYANTKLGQAEIYSYRLDFSESGNYLKTITAANLDLSQIATLLKTITGDDWVVGRNPSNYNLREAAFMYNGLNTNSLYPGNRNYSRILVLNMSLYSLKLGGYLYLHYNA